ncbi:MAG: energy transducer TonB, partial [Candidatus Binatia bacterium]
MVRTLAAGAPLWAQPVDLDEQTLPLWRAALIALGLEVIVPFLVLGVDWSFLPSFYEPPPIPVMSVRLEEPPPETVPEPPPPQRKPEEAPAPKRLKPIRNQIPIEPPKPLPGEAPSKIELPKPEPKPEPNPKEEEKREPQSPPLPSVFRDVKPVKKVKPKYPPEAEAQHIQGRVKVRLTVELDGSVSGVEIVVSEPPGVFEQSVLEAVRQYMFKKDGTTYQA